MIISPGKAGSSDSNSTDMAIRRPDSSFRKRAALMSLFALVLPAPCALSS
jgi:hypothetical protein